MNSLNDSTTLVCLFHHGDQARAALEDLYGAGLPKSSISVIDKSSLKGSGSATIETLGIPERDVKHLRGGVESGGTILAVAASSRHVDAVEDIFSRHQATKIDEAVSRADEIGGRMDESGGRQTFDERAGRDRAAVAAPVNGVGAVSPSVGTEGGAEGGDEPTAIPVIEEQLAVSKRTVDRGGVRVYHRVVEMPAEETIRLRDQHVVVERKPADRAATKEDFEAQGDRSIELTETAEEAVILKNARVVEEVMVGKETGEHVEHIRETVRRTEIEIEELPAATRWPGARRSS